MDTVKPIISIMGPTNTGKTSLAISLAEKLDAEIISVDSVQSISTLISVVIN